MYCKYCGKDIGELEGCPFCGGGESSVRKKEQSKTADNKAALAKKATEKKKGKSEKSTEKAEKDSISFFDKLCKENKFFNFLSTFNRFIALIMIAIFALSVLVTWYFNKEIKFTIALILGVVNAYPYIVGVIIASIAISLIIMMMFVAQMKRKNPSNKSLFSGVSKNGEFDYDSELVDLNNVTWQGIAYKYDKAAFALSIIQMVIRALESLIMVPIFVGLSLSNLKQYSSVGALLREIFSVNRGSVLGTAVFVICGIIILWLAGFIIGLVRKSRHKKLAERYRAKELK